MVFGVGTMNFSNLQLHLIPNLFLSRYLSIRFIFQLSADLFMMVKVPTT